MEFQFKLANALDFVARMINVFIAFLLVVLVVTLAFFQYTQKLVSERYDESGATFTIYTYLCVHELNSLSKVEGEEIMGLVLLSFPL